MRKTPCIIYFKFQHFICDMRIFSGLSNPRVFQVSSACICCEQPQHSWKHKYFSHSQILDLVEWTAYYWSISAQAAVEHTDQSGRHPPGLWMEFCKDWELTLKFIKKSPQKGPKSFFWTFPFPYLSAQEYRGDRREPVKRYAVPLRKVGSLLWEYSWGDK